MRQAIRVIVYMLPLRFFTNRNFAAANLAAAFVYGGVTLGSLAIVRYLQEVGGYSPSSRV